MSKKKKKNRSNNKPVNQINKINQEKAPERSVPKFEIGVKGDEFDIAYTRAAKKEQNRAEALFRSISKESDRVAVDLICFAALSLFVIFMALSFALLSRGGKPPVFRAEKLADGSFLRDLGIYYDDTLPFAHSLSKLGNALGLCELRDENYDPDEDLNEDEPPLETRPAEPLITTTEAATTAETTTVTTTPPETTVTTVPTQITTAEITEPDTERMYAQGTIQVRLEPDRSSMIMGYYYRNERVKVVNIRDDGWAEIWFGGAIMYVEADGIGKSRVVVTEATTTGETTAPETTTEPTTEEPMTTTPETTTAEETTVEETSATTKSERIVDPFMSMLMGRGTSSTTTSESGEGSESATTEVTTATTTMTEETTAVTSD